MAEPTTPDEFEQRQRLDGSLDEPTTIAGEDGPLDPDELEQRRSADGSVDLDVRDAGDAPLSPDELEQRQSVDDDDPDDHPRGDEDDDLTE